MPLFVCTVPNCDYTAACCKSLAYLTHLRKERFWCLVYQMCQILKFGTSAMNALIHQPRCVNPTGFIVEPRALAWQALLVVSSTLWSPWDKQVCGYDCPRTRVGTRNDNHSSLMRVAFSTIQRKILWTTSHTCSCSCPTNFS